ncbi:MAG: hypothetical protein SPG64_03270 [Candidatus Enteromonas sp.]|nr:hypothetical protein [Candidatus Enteromonas sp.]
MPFLIGYILVCDAGLAGRLVYSLEDAKEAMDQRLRKLFDPADSQCNGKILMLFQERISTEM